MRNRRSRIKGIAWLAVAAWMVVIFLFSAQNDTQSGDTSGMVVRCFYPCFTGVLRTFRRSVNRRFWKPGIW